MKSYFLNIKFTYNNYKTYLNILKLHYIGFLQMNPALMKLQKLLNLFCECSFWANINKRPLISKKQEKQVLGQKPRVKLFTVIVAFCNHATYFMWQIK